MKVKINVNGTYELTILKSGEVLQLTKKEFLELDPQAVR